MNPIPETLLYLLKVALWDEQDTESAPDIVLTDEEWMTLYKSAQKQGVASIITDSLGKLPSSSKPPRKVVLSWSHYCLQSEERWKKQVSVATRLADCFYKHGIRTLLLKGLGVGLFYPKPFHRECGDVDIYLFGQYEEGNTIAKTELGAKVVKYNKKEDHLSVSGISIDNHIQLCWVNSYKDAEVNSMLIHDANSLVYDNYYPDTKLLLPDDTFNYLFLLKHSYEHFMGEGMSLRQITDIALFLQNRNQALDWAVVDNKLRSAGLKRFSDAIRSFICYYLNPKIGQVTIDKPLMERLRSDVLSDGHQVVYHKHIIAHKWYTLQKVFANKWKYNAFYEGGFKTYLMDRLLSHFKKV